jgi:hypothetical protein
MQYLRKGLVVAARKRKCLLNNMKVVIFQLMINMPTAIPTSEALIKFTFPKYSGARYREFTPYVFMKDPFTALKRITQKMINIWNFLK